MKMLAWLCALAPVQDEKSTATVELCGVVTFEGISFKQGDQTKYTGDTYLLKLAFLGEKGGAWQPTPTLNFVVYNGDQPLKKVQRIVTKQQWNADASKVGKLNVADNTIACDKKTNELWVAFVRSDGGSFDPRFDLKLEIRGVGTWEWKGIDKEKEFKVAARGPDKLEKK